MSRYLPLCRVLMAANIALKGAALRNSSQEYLWFPKFSKTVFIGSPPWLRTAVFPKHFSLHERGLIATRAFEFSSDSQTSERRVGRGVNVRKRTAEKAKDWAEDLTRLNKREIYNFVRYAELDERVHEAILLAKEIGPKGKNGWRRQISYLGGLLRAVNLDLIQLSFQAAKTGDLRDLDSWKLENRSPESEENEILDNDESELEEYEDEDEKDEEEDMGFSECPGMAEKWFVGLTEGNQQVTNEVYGIDDNGFDRQELRRSVRELLSERKRVAEMGGDEIDEESLLRAQKSVEAKEKKLQIFLDRIAQRVLDQRD